MSDSNNFNPAKDDKKLKSLPHNLEAEQALLGAILLDNQVLTRLGDKFSGEHFYDPVHGKIFDTVRNISSRGHVADGITLHARFAQDGALADIGGAAYLALLIDSAADPAAAPDYAKLIFDLALRRELIRIGGELNRDANTVSDELDGAEKIIEETEERLYKLGENGQSSSGFVAFQESLKQALTTAAAAATKTGDIVGLTTGFSEVDHMLGGLHKSDLLILAGRPSMGKTALATNIAFNAAKAFEQKTDEYGVVRTVRGGVVAFYSLEMSAEQLTMRLLADYTGIGSDRIRKGELGKAEYAKLQDASIDLANLPLYIDDTGGISLAALTARARRLQRRAGLDLIVIDYLQLISSPGSRGDNRVQEVTEITKGLKALAKELNVPIIALSQLSRQVENRDDKRPQLADLRESGSIEQDADCVMFVYRESYYLLRQEPPLEPAEKHFEWQNKVDACQNTAELIIAKQRHGAIGKIKLGFRAELTKFSDLDYKGQDDDDYE